MKKINFGLITLILAIIIFFLNFFGLRLATIVTIGSFVAWVKYLSLIMIITGALSLIDPGKRRSMVFTVLALLLFALPIILGTFGFSIYLFKKF